MVLSKKIQLEKLLVFCLLVVFPFGQLFRISIYLQNFRFVIQPLDILAGIFLFLLLVKRYFLPWFLKPLVLFLIAAAFSFVLSIFFFKNLFWITGFLYLFRLFAYLSFCIVLWNLLITDKLSRELLFNCLLIISAFAGFFGWIQYLFLPDLRALKYLGWDDHLYRMVGTFLDPGFLSGILVFGALGALSKVLIKKDFRYLGVFLFFLITLAFTYSRAGYLALFAGSFYLFFKTAKAKVFLLLVGLFFLILIFLPRPNGEGVKLERIFSILARYENYKGGLAIFSKFPLFGVGYNNICFAKDALLGEKEYFSNSCSGLDSSFLLILATTGLVGLLVFLSAVQKIIYFSKPSFYKDVLKAISFALLVHGSFVNSLFYPWILIWVLVVLALTYAKSFAKMPRKE